MKRNVFYDDFENEMQYWINGENKLFVQLVHAGDTDYGSNYIVLEEQDISDFIDDLKILLTGLRNDKNNQ